MNYTKFRIVEKDGKYAIQGLERQFKAIGFYENRFGSKKWEYILDAENDRWKFIESSTSENDDKFNIQYSPFTFSMTLYKQHPTLDKARAALKDYMWKNLVEPTEEDKVAKEWVQVDKE